MQCDLHGQFVLGRGDLPAPPGFEEDRLASFTLRHHPALPVRRVLRGDGTPIGWLLGHAFGARGSPAPPRVRARDDCDAHGIADAHWGRFVVALVGTSSPELALDAMGSLAVVYDPARERVGSTTTALDPETPARGRHLDPFTFHPAPCTGDPALRRLLPNHRLDLRSWRAERRRPEWPLRYASLDFETRAARVADALGRNLESLAEQAPLTLALSSGYDSRLVLACARPVWDRLELVTFDYRERRSDLVDAAIARSIARTLRLPHRVLSATPASDAEQERYRRRIGYAGHGGKARDFDAALRRHVDLGRALVTGIGVDITRSLYWERPPRGDVRGRSSDDLLHLLRLYVERWPDADWRRAVEAWSAPLSSLPLHELYDLLLFEQKNGCWAMPHFYGFAPFALCVVPACSRELVDLILSAPLEQKLEKRLVRAVVRHACPALDAIPYKVFDRAGLWRYRLRRALGGWRPMSRRAAAGSHLP